MSFKAVKVVESLIREYQANVAKIDEIAERLQDKDASFEYTKMCVGARGSYITTNLQIAAHLHQAGIDVTKPLEEQILTVDRTMALCNRRGWPAAWSSRMSILVEELSEYFAALRGKGSQDIVGEGGDMINALYAALGISGVSPIEFEEAMVKKIAVLWNAARRPGEHYEEGHEV